MSSIEQQSWSALAPRNSRQVDRALSAIDNRTAVAVAGTHARADIQSAQVDAVTAVGQRAMQGVAFLSQIEGQLGQAVPLAVTRLEAIGDLSSLALGQIVADTVTQLRRSR